VAEKKPMIVIKKITVVSGGAHGGAWKVAFADFMTAMMAFFLVMWLLAQASDAQKKGIADYFSTPSVIEYNFKNYGVEMTLEKLFLDLVNEPLETLAGLMQPMDKTPNMMSLGTKEIVMTYLAEQLGDLAQDVEVTGDAVVFEVPDTVLFKLGEAAPSEEFVSVMEKINSAVAGLEDSELTVTSVVYNESVEGEDPEIARQVSKARVDLLSDKLATAIESESTDLIPRFTHRPDDRGEGASSGEGGSIRFEIKQKRVLSSGKPARPIAGETFGKKDQGKSVYENFVKQVSQKSSGKSQNPKRERP